MMRILIFHGYLLSGTGSNVYNARLAEALVKLGHDVHLLSQDRHPERYPFVKARGDWDSGVLQVVNLDQHTPDASQGGYAEGKGRCTVYRPNIGGLLPLYVLDRYEGIEAKTFAECSDEEIALYVKLNVEAVREVAQLVCPDVALANHLVMGPVILARGLEGDVSYAVKVHGSALEYTVKPEPERFLGFAREGLAEAKTILVGSRHTAESLSRALEDPDLEQRTRLGPPGVDIERFVPRDPQAAQAAMGDLLERLRISAGMSSEEQSSAFARDDGVASEALERILDRDGVLVAFVGKLIVSKGVDLLVAAWPLVLQAVPSAMLVVIGFGAYREGLELLIAKLQAGDLEGAKEIAHAGRELETSVASPGPMRSESGKGDFPEGEGDSVDRVPLGHLLAFLRSLSGPSGDGYRSAARTLAQQIVLTGRLDHEELSDILPACEALVVPSTFPEAFGMVAAEAAACGTLPISAGHSGLAEVSEALSQEVPDRAASWLSFPVDDDAVRAIATRVVAWLKADAALKEGTREALVAVTRERWSWEGVARGVIGAARGEPDTRPFG